MDRNALAPLLARNDVFKALSEGEREAIVDASVVREVGRAERILSEGDPSRELYVLLEGRVGVYYSTPSGTNVLVKVFGSPAVFGEMELFFDAPRQEYVEAFSATRLLVIPGKVAIDVLRNNGAASFALLKDVSARLSIAAYNEKALAFHSVDVRLAELLLTFLDAFGKENADGSVTIQTPLTYDHLAKCVAASTRSVERTLTQWMQEGWLSRRNKRYIVGKRAALEGHGDEQRLVLHTRLGLTPHR